MAEAESWRRLWQHGHRLDRTAAAARPPRASIAAGQLAVGTLLLPARCQVSTGQETSIFVRNFLDLYCNIL